MHLKHTLDPRRLAALAAFAGLIALAAPGCERDTSGLEPYPLSTDPLVFDDNLGPGVDYQAFLGSKLDAISVDPTDRAEGTASLKVIVPGPETNLFAGGAFTANAPRDLSGYNALTFYAKASMDATLDVGGIANDNTGTSKYQAGISDIALTTSWQQYVIPIPLPARLSAEAGLFFFAESHENNMGYTIWFDDIRFASVPGVSNPRPNVQAQTIGSFVGATVVPITWTTFRVNSADATVVHMPAYFDYASSADSVAVPGLGEIRVVGPGSATVTAELGDIPAAGEITINATAPPMVAAPRPTLPAADVLSLFSDAYNNFAVYSWLSFGTGTLTDIKVAGDNVKAYTNLTFVGIQFLPPPPPPPDPATQIDATQYTHFHIDVWVPDAIAVRIKLVDFGEDGRFGGAPDSEHEITLSALSTPPLENGKWISYDIPFADFTNLTSRAHLAQLIPSIQGNERTLFIDNIYFHK